MRNPIRRSKKIGLTQGGRVKDGKPEEKWSKLFPQNIWESISYNNEKWKFYIENPSKNYYHPCEINEYINVLKKIPSHHSKYVKGIILKRASKTDKKLKIEARKIYCCVILNPFPKNMKYIFDNKPNDSTIKHYQPFSTNWTEEKGKWILSWSNEEVKKYYLYHLFLHEIGHILDCKNNDKTQREKYAESFARDVAKDLGFI